VIELAHDHLRPPAQAVIERRDAIQQDQAQTVDRNADDLYRRAVERGEDQQPDRAETRQRSTDQVRPGIEAFAVIHPNPPENHDASSMPRQRYGIQTGREKRWARRAVSA